MSNSIEFANHENYNCRITLLDGRQFLVYANWIHNNNLDQWKDWNCCAGVDRIFIDHDGKVYDGECKNSLLGDMNDDWNIKVRNICTRNRCTGCTDDLIISKQRNNIKVSDNDN
jgi:hypothetical protein